MSIEAFDLAERLQTPVMVMSDLDIGMNDWMTREFAWDETYTHDRGKVLDAAGLDARPDWGRYQDPDGDGIPYRTYPGAHPSRGAYFTRGTSHDEDARYTEDGQIHARVLDRLTRKFATAALLVPAPEIEANGSRVGLVYFGASEPAVKEALDMLADEGHRPDAMRIRAFPFSDAVRQFAADHDVLFVIEQNRDMQMRTLLTVEAGIEQDKLIGMPIYDGMPLTAKAIADGVRARLKRAQAAAE